jgi:hypothetical protein
MKTHKNRYGDIFTFVEDDNGDILWEGNFEYGRVGYPNDYTKAYNAYVADGGLLSLNEFQDGVHEWDEENQRYVLGFKYASMVESLKYKIDMVDPSGGPYISVGMFLDYYGYKDYKVKDIEKIKKGYKLITEKCSGCNKPGAIHKMSCPTQKTTIFISDEVKAFYNQMEKEVHFNRGNLNK